MYLRQLLRNLFRKSLGFQYDYVFDWTILNNQSHGRDTSSSRAGEKTGKGGSAPRSLQGVSVEAMNANIARKLLDSKSPSTDSLSASKMTNCSRSGKEDRRLQKMTELNETLAGDLVEDEKADVQWSLRLSVFVLTLLVVIKYLLSKFGMRYFKPKLSTENEDSESLALEEGV